jgi:hypothetical protein
MPRRKPTGWPKLMVPKRLKGGDVGYYWDAPTWARRNGCPVIHEALGKDYAVAKQRCDEVLNPQYDAWRTHGEAVETSDRPSSGTFDWMIALYKSSPRYSKKPIGTQKSYDRVLRLVSTHKLKDGRLFGSLSLASITPGAADRLFEKLKQRADGSERI